MTARRLLAALLVVSATVAAAPPAAAADRTSAGTPQARLLVAPRGGGLVARGRPVDVDVRVTNTGTAPLPAGNLTFSLRPGPSASSAELLAGITAPTTRALQGLLLTRTRARTPALEPGASAELTTRIPVADLSETLTSADGARVLYARLQASTARAFAESVLVRMGRSAPRIGLGTVVPITAPRGSTGVVDTAAQGSLTGPDGAWTRALEAARAMPSATIALDPAVIASIRLAGDAAPDSATAFLGDLRDLSNQTVRLPYADGDRTLQRAAGLAGALEPTSFAGASAQPAPATATPAPDPAPAPGATASATELTDWDWSATEVVWPVPDTATAADLAAFGADGTVLLGSSDVVDTPERAAAGPLATVGGTRALVADRTVSGLLSRSAGSGIAAASATAALVGALATEAAARSAPAVLAVAGRGTDPTGLARVLGLLERQRWLRGDSLQTLVAAPRPVGVVLRGGSTPPGRTATARALVQAGRAIARLGSAVRDPDALVAPSRLALLGALSAQWRQDQAGWSAASQGVLSTLRDVPGRVSIDTPSARTAIGTDGRLRFTVRNELAQPVTVQVRPSVDNGRLRFTERRSVRVAVPANASAPGQLAFRPIANGRTGVTLTLAAPDGSRIGSPAMVVVNVQAGVDIVIAAVLLTALGLLLALGVYRNIVRRRRPRTAR